MKKGGISSPNMNLCGNSEADASDAMCLQSSPYQHAISGESSTPKTSIDLVLAARNLKRDLAQAWGIDKGAQTFPQVDAS